MITPIVSLIIVPLLMQVIKKLSGFLPKNNSDQDRILLNGLLAFLSLLGALATMHYSGQQLDPNMVSEWVEAIIVAALSYFASSGVYQNAVKPLLK